MPHATCPVATPMPSARRARAGRSTRSCRPRTQCRCTATNNERQRPEKLDAGRGPTPRRPSADNAGRDRQPPQRCSRRRPPRHHRTIGRCTTTASCRPPRAATIMGRPRSLRRPRGTATRAPTRSVRAEHGLLRDAPDHDRLRDPFGPPCVQCRRPPPPPLACSTTPRSGIDDVMAPPGRPGTSTSDPTRARHQHRPATVMHERGARSVERMVHRHAPRAASGEPHPGPHVRRRDA